MASRVEKLIKSLLLHEVRLAGSFLPAGTSNPSSFKGKGITSIVRNGGAGLFLITFDDAWAKLVSANGTVQLNAAADMAVQFGAYTPANPATGAKATLVLRTQAGATPTDISANANNSVSFDLVFSNSIYD